MNTPNLDLPLLEESQASAEVVHNDALTRLDVLAQIYVLSRTEPDPPGSPANGDAYLVPASPTGDWAGKENYIAQYADGWVFTQARPGMQVYVGDDDEVIVRLVSSTWVRIMTGVPTALTHAEYVLGGTTAIPAAYAAVAGLSLSLPVAGTYRIWANLRYYFIAGSVTVARLYDATNAAVITNSERMIGVNMNATQQGTVSMEWHITVAGPVTIDLQAEDGGYGGNFLTGGAGQCVTGYTLEDW